MDGISERSSITKERSLLESPRILVIDHNANAMRLTTALLHRYSNSEVVIVTSLREGDELFRETRRAKQNFDIIMCAYQFPDESMNGLEFARRVREGNYRRNPLFILRTESPEIDPEKDYSDQGVDIVLPRVPLQKDLIAWFERLELAHAMKVLR